MKVSTVRQPKEAFKPISLNIIIESQKELDFFYCLFNSSMSDLYKLANESARYFKLEHFSGGELGIGTNQIWTLLKDIKKNDL